MVSLCDADSNLLNECADMCAERQLSKKRPRTYKHYQELLDQKDVDIALIATPDHWHALPMIAAAKAGCDIYVQKPISVDIREGQAMLAAARKYKRVVQVGMQRRSTPHLITARDRIVREGKLGTIGLVEIYCYYAMRATQNPPDAPPPPNLDYELWTGPAPMRPYNDLVHPRKWRAYGVRQRHRRRHVRACSTWCAGCSTSDAQSRRVVRRHLVQNQPRQHHRHQTATFDFGNLPVIWTHRTYGARPIRNTRRAPRSTATRARQGERDGLRLRADAGRGDPRGRQYELEEYPIDKVEKDLEARRAGHPRPHEEP